MDEVIGQVMTCERAGLAVFTFRWVELVAVFFTPASWSNVCRVSVYPEVIALRVPIDMETQPTANHLADRKERHLCCQSIHLSITSCWQQIQKSACRSTRSASVQVVYSQCIQQNVPI